MSINRLLTETFELSKQHHILKEKLLAVIIKSYDNGDFVHALNLMWELIEKLPNKTGTATQSQVVMPAKTGKQPVLVA